MKFSTLLLLLASSAAYAQTIISLTPGRNAPAAPRSTFVSATLSTTPGAGASSALRVFGTQADGRKAGIDIVGSNTVVLQPRNEFKPGETVMATLTSGAGAPQVWQFTAAATGGTGYFSAGSRTLQHPSFRQLTDPPVSDNDGDGDLDIMSGVNDGSSGEFRPYLNNGLGTFTTGTAIANTSIRKQLLADLDADGDLDLIAIPNSLSSLSIYFNNGRGVFGSLRTVATTGNASVVSIGDLDADGDLDLVAASNSTINVLLNNGLAAFSAATSINLSAEFCCLGDIDNDGDLDLVATGAGFPGLVAVRRNTGNGTFTTSPSITNGSIIPVNSVLLNDFDNDGDLDMALATGASSSGLILKIRLNNGGGTFGGGSDINSPFGQPVFLTAGDVDGDGDLDLLCSNGQGSAYMVARYSNNGAGTFTYTDYLSSSVNSIRRAQLADFDGDGDLDLVYPYEFDFRIHIFFNSNRVSATANSKGSSWLQVSPNPVGAGTSWQVQIEATKAQVALRTITGNLVRQQAVSGPAATIPTAGLAPGLYLLTVQADGQAPLTRRLVVE